MRCEKTRRREITQISAIERLPQNDFEFSANTFRILVIKQPFPTLEKKTTRHVESLYKNRSRTIQRSNSIRKRNRKTKINQNNNNRP